jgi:DinB superfamily
MTNDPTKLSLPEILAEAEAVAKDTQMTFGHLDGNQINWKPGADKWSIGQCFEHLINANQEYLPILSQVIRDQKKTSLWQRMPFLPSFFGKLVVKSVSPDSKQKLKAPKLFQPASSKIDPQIIGKFVAHQNDMIAKMKATEGKDLEKIIIYSPVSKMVIYSLLNAYRIIVAHERRHFRQAQRVMEASGFPK